MWKPLLFCTVFFVGALAQKGRQILSSEVVEERREFEQLLIDVLLNSLKPYKCVAILCDQIYYAVFGERIFQNMGLYISFFVVLIEDDDDLLSPYPDTKEALITIKSQGCQTYIILLSNGIQMSRLLRYGDRYRVLDTRVNFIILYDNRLFEKDLHYIWKRIINVVFVREYSGTKKVGSERKIIPWFELTTVPFPSPIKGVFVPRRLDIWRQNKFRSGVDLFRDKTSDLRNQSMKVVTFQHVPATLKVPVPEYRTAKTVMPLGEEGITGIEVEILATVSQIMNFFPELYEPENVDVELWGTKQSDGQYTGLFGELLKSHADVGLGDFYYTPEILTMMDLTLPYGTECLTFLTPESSTDNSWKTLILPFKPVMWLGVIIFLVLCGLIFYGMAQFHYRTRKRMRRGEAKVVVKRQQKKIDARSFVGMDRDVKYAFLMQEVQPPKPESELVGFNIFGEIINSFLYTFSMLLMVSLPTSPGAWSMRVLTGSYWIYCLLVVVAYRASMTAILANPAPIVTIDTLEELVDSHLALGGWTHINKDLFLTSPDPISQDIGTKFEITNNTQLAIDRVAAGEFAFFDNVYSLMQGSVKRKLRLEIHSSNNDTEPPLSKSSDDRNLHLMSNCVINIPISLGLQKNSPIKPRVDKFIRRVIEAGLVKKWLDDVMQSTLNADVEPEAIQAFMTMRKFSGGLIALFVGYFVSVSAFVTELVYFYRVVKRHPDYDKYSRSIAAKNE